MFYCEQNSHRGRTSVSRNERQNTISCFDYESFFYFFTTLSLMYHFSRNPVDRVTNKLAKIVTLEARSAIADNSAMRVAFFTTIGIRASIDHLQQNSKCVMFFVRHSCMTTVTLTNVSNYADAKPREGRGFSKPDVINHSFRYVSPYLWNQLP